MGIFILICLVSYTFYFLVSPINDETPVLLARTYPTLWDVLIAIFGGTAGVIAKTEEDGGNVVPGVAIATALMPPLCVVGFGIAHGNPKIFLGAGYLFIINVFFIMIATLVGLIVYSGNIFEARNKISIKKQIIFYIVSLIIIIPSIYTATTLVQDTARENSLKKFISGELKNHYVFDNSINKKDKTVTLKIVGDAFKKQDIEKLEKKLEKYKLKNYKLKIQQLSNEKYLTAQDLSKYLNEEKIKENAEDVSLPIENKNQEILENDLKTVENILYKNFSNNISEVKIGKLIDANNNENFVFLVVGNETMTYEISENIKNIEFYNEKKYQIIIEKNKQEKVNTLSEENQK